MKEKLMLGAIVLFLATWFALFGPAYYGFWPWLVIQPANVAA